VIGEDSVEIGVQTLLV